MRLRSGDKPRFEMKGQPPGLAINRKTGLIAGFLTVDTAGEYEVTVTVKDADRGMSDTGKLRLIVAGK